MSEKKRPKLPNRLIAVPNADKGFHEKWTRGRGMLNFPHPFRGAIKNIIMHADPPFEEIKVIHCDPEYTQEYDDIEVAATNVILSPDEWDGEAKTHLAISSSRI